MRCSASGLVVSPPKLLCFSVLQYAPVQCAPVQSCAAVNISGWHTNQPTNINGFYIQIFALHLCCLLIQCCSVCCELLQINLLQPGNHLGRPPPPIY